MAKKRKVVEPSDDDATSKPSANTHSKSPLTPTKQVVAATRTPPSNASSTSASSTVSTLPSKRRRIDTFDGALNYFLKSLHKDKFTEGEIEDVLWEIAAAEWNGNVFNDCKWTTKKVTVRKLTGEERQICMCAYQYSSLCGWRFEKIKHNNKVPPTYTIRKKKT